MSIVAVVDPHRGVQRLHARRGRRDRRSSRRDDLGGALDRRVGVANLDHVDARLAPVGRDRAIVLQHAVVVIGLRRRFLRPGDFEQRLGLHRGVDRFRDHADAGGQRHDLDHALDGFGRGVVDLLGAFILHVREEDRRIEHAGQLHIDAVLRRAVDLRAARRRARYRVPISRNCEAGLRSALVTSGSGFGTVAVLAISP